jgi:hypothetical protein
MTKVFELMVQRTADKNSVLVTVTVHKCKWAVRTYRINVIAFYLCGTETFCFIEYVCHHKMAMNCPKLMT